MPWVRTEDRARCHPKFFRAGCLAFGWWNAALGYCNEHLTNGFIPIRDLELVFPGMLPADRAAAIESLVREVSVHAVSKGQRPTCHSQLCRRFTAREDGYLMHDFLVYQPSRKFTENLRRVRTEVARKGGVESGKRRKQIASTHANQTNELSEPVPSRPVPSQETKDSKKQPTAVCDDGYLGGLKTNPAYQRLSIEQEFGKASAWASENRRQVTRRFFINWLNRAAERVREIAPTKERHAINAAWQGKTTPGDVKL